MTDWPANGTNVGLEARLRRLDEYRNMTHSVLKASLVRRKNNLDINSDFTSYNSNTVVVSKSSDVLYVYYPQYDLCVVE